MKRIFRYPLYILSVLVLGAMLHGNAFAQKGTYSGKIIESGPNTPMEFVNVTVYDTLTQKLVKGSISNADGQFTIEDLPFGRPLQATFSSMGFASKTGKAFMLSTQKPAANAGTIKMETAAQLLKAVNITGQKRTIEYSLDRKIVNVEQSLVSEGGSAVDVLENVPSISVDEEGNISMKGSESVTILIDGRPASFSGLGLDQISASNIANIEIISNPSAKYNPEGTSGIINIITKERKHSEINGNINASVSTSNRYNLGANLSFGFKKVTLFTNIDASYRNRVSEGTSSRTSFRDSNNLAFPADNIQKEIQDKSTRGGGGFGGKFQLGTDIKINPNNTFLISGTYEYWGRDRFNDPTTTRTFSYLDTDPDVWHDIRLKTTSSSSNEASHGAQGALSYKHKFDRNPKQELTFDATVNYRGPLETSENLQRLTEYRWNEGLPDTVTSESRQTTTTHRQDMNFDAQLNYIHPFNEKLTLEVGYQGKLQWQKSLSIYDSRLNKFQDTAVDFAYVSHNHGIYANLMGKFGNFTFQVGGRFELDFMNAHKKTWGGKEEVDASFSYIPNPRFRFYPALHLSYKIGQKQELQLSYSRRVNRPGPWNLDPFIDYRNYPSSISYGKPSLQPQDIHSVELNYSLFVKQTSIFATVYYRYLTDVIRRYQFEDFIDGLDDYILVQTFDNYDKGHTYGVDLSLEQQILKWWRMSLSGSLHQNFTRDASLTTPQEGLSYRANFSTTMNLPLDFVLQLSVRYRGPSYWGQTRFDHNVSGELALRKTFLKKRLSLGLRIRDLFHTQQWNNTVTGDGFVSTRSSRAKGIYSTALFVTVSYKINKGIQEKRPRGGGGSGSAGDESEEMGDM